MVFKEILILNLR